MANGELETRLIIMVIMFGLIQSRAEPDGAVSSPTPSPTSAAQQEYIDTKTPYIQRIIDQKCGSPKSRYAIDKSEVRHLNFPSRTSFKRPPE